MHSDKLLKSMLLSLCWSKQDPQTPFVTSFKIKTSEIHNQISKSTMLPLLCTIFHWCRNFLDNSTLYIIEI